LVVAEEEESFRKENKRKGMQARKLNNHKLNDTESNAKHRENLTDKNLQAPSTMCRIFLMFSIILEIKA
jgi:hypothetical protein